jgi:SurA N-terminal domain
MREGTDYRIVRRWVASAGVALVLLCLTFVVLAGAQTPTMACPPPPPAEGTPATPGPVKPAPEQIVACIGPQSITGATFQHWAHVARRAEGPSKHHQSRDAVVQQVMGFLISADWVLGEAQARNIVVSEAAVRHTFDHLRAQQFPKRRAFKRFLKQSGQTVADILLRVRLSILSGRIQSTVVAGHHGARSRRRALESFIHEFKAEWKAQTYCAPAYAVQDCGHVQATL